MCARRSERRRMHMSFENAVTKNKVTIQLGFVKQRRRTLRAARRRNAVVTAPAEDDAVGSQRAGVDAAGA